MDSGEIISSLSVAGDIPYRGVFTVENQIVLICKEKTLIYDVDGGLKGECVYPSNILSYYVSNEFVALEIDVYFTTLHVSDEPSL